MKLLTIKVNAGDATCDQCLHLRLVNRKVPRCMVLHQSIRSDRYGEYRCAECLAAEARAKEGANERD